MRRSLKQLSQQERLNFLLTNRIPRQTLTLLAGRYSRIRSRWLARASIAVWRQFTDDLHLEEAESRDYQSMHECFTRRLKAGARIVDARPDIVASPCDAEIGMCGRIDGTTVYQAKGFPYELSELIPDATVQARFRDGWYVTLRRKSSMYHRFHAPVDCQVDTMTYISGDTWNVNPIALQRIEKLFCRNERAVLPLEGMSTTGSLCLVPVAAILVASMRFTGLPDTLDLRYRGPNRIQWSRRFAKGEEMGYFQHGSTIIVFATANYALCDGITSGTALRMGQSLLVDRAASQSSESP